MNPKEYSVLIGSPAFGCQLHIDYHNTIIDLLSTKPSNVQITNFLIGNQSLITRARNTIISYFYYEKQYTHLLFLDVDVSVQARDILKLIYSGKDVIGAPVPLKGSSKVPVFNTGEMIKEENSDLYKTNFLGTAVFLLSRKAVDALIINSKGYSYDPKFSRTNNNNNNELPQAMYDVFEVGVINNNYLSEDYFVCYKLNKMGINVYVDTSIQVIHNGMLPIFPYITESKEDR